MDNRQDVVLPPDLAKLLVQLDNGWQPMDFSLPAFPTLYVNEQPWPGAVLGIIQDGDSLIIRLQIYRQDWQNTANLRVTAQTEDGGHLDALSNSVSTAYGEPLIITVTCRQWSYTPNESPVLWVAPLHQVAKINTPGNVFTKRRQSEEVYNTSRTGLRLAAEQLAFYILNTKLQGGTEQVLLAFESLTAELPTSKALSLELPLLRIVLSTPIRPGVFYGLSADGQTVAALAAPSEHAALPVNDRDLSLVPMGYHDTLGRAAWLAPFYQKLHAANAANGGISSVSFSLSRYGHSIAPIDVDTQFELVAGAVWILANHLSEVPEAAANRVFDVQLLAGQETYSGSLQALAWLATTYGTSGRIVGQELQRALWELMYGTLADYRAPEGASQAILQRYNRVQLLRRAYAVLLARAIGYQGQVKQFEPLIDKGPDEWWAKDKSGHQQAGWLPAPEDEEQDMTEARRLFRAEADITGLSVWPEFNLPELPQDDLVRAFTAFAEELRQHTKGRVYARLRRLPRRGSEPAQLSFRLLLVRAPATQVALFTIELLKKGFVVQGWRENPVRITTPKALDGFQQQLLASREFHYEVERLLLIEEDIRRGEA